MPWFSRLFYKFFMKKNPYRLRLERNFQKKKSFHTNNDGKKLNFYAVPQGFFFIPSGQRSVEAKQDLTKHSIIIASHFGELAQSFVRCRHLYTYQVLKVWLLSKIQRKWVCSALKSASIVLCSFLSFKPFFRGKKGLIRANYI